MLRLALALAAGGLLLVSTAQSADRTRHSGHIKAVSPNGQTIVLEEVGPGLKGSSTNQVISRPIALTPETRITLASRTEEGNGSSEWSGGFKETPLAPTDLRVGDYATVEAQTRDGRLVAVSVVVVRPTNSSR
jgi:hypothetical protein